MSENLKNPIVDNDFDKWYAARQLPESRTKDFEVLRTHLYESVMQDRYTCCDDLLGILERLVNEFGEDFELAVDFWTSKQYKLGELLAGQKKLRDYQNSIAKLRDEK